MYSEKLNKDFNKILEESFNIKAKYTYSEARGKYTEYLTELFKLNHLNVGNKCSICLTNIVDTFYNPCGHTICASCDKPDIHKKCHICRANVHSVKKLYFI